MLSNADIDRPLGSFPPTGESQTETLPRHSSLETAVIETSVHRGRSSGPERQTHQGLSRAGENMSSGQGLPTEADINMTRRDALMAGTALSFGD